MARTELTGKQIKDQSVVLTEDVTGVLPVANGGSGSDTLALNAVLLGNGSGALQAVAPGTTGHVLTSNGTTWVAAAPTGGTGGGGAVSGFSQLVGDGTATTITVTHDLGTRAVAVAVYDATTWVEVEADVVASSTSAVTLTFGTAPAVDEFLVAVVAGGGGSGSSSATTLLSGHPIAGRYAATIGDGTATSITVTHNLGTRDVTIAIYDTSTYEHVNCDKWSTTTNTVTLGFAVAPATDSYRVVVVG